MRSLREIILDTGKPLSFTTHDLRRLQIQEICQSHPDIASFYDLGPSEKGRPIFAVRLGRGNHAVSLIAGAHSDEPVGPLTLTKFILNGVQRKDALKDLFQKYTFHIIPHINPDGEVRNRTWISQWPDPEAYIVHAFREPPGRDLEFGFPSMRPENRIVSDYLRDNRPYHLHMSLHGMGFGEGVMLLIDRHWSFRTRDLCERFAGFVHEVQLELHDHNRKGEKGFFYIEPGFTTTPEGEAMRTFFYAKDDPYTASLFYQSSMEYVRTLGGDPLCLVTEVPLFMLTPSRKPGTPENYLKFRDLLPELRLRAIRGNDIASDLKGYGIQPVDLEVAVNLQLCALELGLKQVSDGGNAR